MPAHLAHYIVLDMARGLAQLDQDSPNYLFLECDPIYMSQSGFKRGPLSQYAYLGAMGPDLAGGGTDDVTWLFDVIHWKKSNQFVANWLQTLAEEEPANTFQMKLAFIFGFLSHMAADTIVHPYVNTFAGAYDNQSIHVAVPSALEIGRADMHRFVELQQDAYIAGKYFKVAGMSEPTHSWSRFWSEAMGYIEMDNSWERILPKKLAPFYPQIEHTVRLESLVTTYVKVANDTYNPPSGKTAVTIKGLTEAIKKRFTLLDIGYDNALGPIPNKPELDFVHHPKRDRDYDDYLTAAANLTTKYWKAAFKFLRSIRDVNDRKEFYEAVPNFNLDTGFAIRVYSKPTRIFIRHDHSWSLFL